MSDVAILTGSKGNLGPVWAETLRAMGIPFYSMDYPESDVTSMQCRQEALQECMALHGPPSILINNAGIDSPPGGPTPFFGNMERIIDVNLIGAAAMAEACMRVMVACRRGLIVNIGSIQGFVGADWRTYPPGFEKPVSYNMSKAGLNQLSRSIAVQYGRYGIRAVTIAFGAVEGKHDPEFSKRYLNNVPLGRFVSKASLAATLRYVIECPEITGQTILIDGGYTAL